MGVCQSTPKTVKPLTENDLVVLLVRGTDLRQADIGSVSHPPCWCNDLIRPPPPPNHQSPLSNMIALGNVELAAAGVNGICPDVESARRHRVFLFPCLPLSLLCIS